MESKDMDLSLLTLPELSEYILGDKFIGEYKESTLCTAQQLKEFLTHLASSEFAKSAFSASENWKDFYTVIPDFKHYFKADVREDVYYAAKNGMVASGVPAFCIYMVKKAYAKIDIPNMIFKQIPIPVMRQWFRPGYIRKGICLRDVICQFCNAQYNPVTPYRYTNTVGDYTEIYVKETDMIAAVPNVIAKSLNMNDIEKITVSQYGLSINNVLLRTMAGYAGAINSTYDLRKLL